MEFNDWGICIFKPIRPKLRNKSKISDKMLVLYIILFTILRKTNKISMNKFSQLI